MTTPHPKYIIEPADLTVFALDSMTARKLCSSAGCALPKLGNFSILAVGEGYAELRIHARGLAFELEASGHLATREWSEVFGLSPYRRNSVTTAQGPRGARGVNLWAQSAERAGRA